MNNARKRWKAEDIKTLLLRHYHDGWHTQKIAISMGRTQHGVANKLIELRKDGIDSLNKYNEKHALVEKQIPPQAKIFTPLDEAEKALKELWDNDGDNTHKNRAKEAVFAYLSELIRRL